MDDCPGDTCKKKTFSWSSCDCLFERSFRIPLIELELHKFVCISFLSAYRLLTNYTTGSFLMNVIFHTLPRNIQEAPCELKWAAKFHFIQDILIFHGHSQYKSFSKLLFDLASISLKMEVFEKIHTKSVEILCKNIRFTLMFSHFIFRA